VIIWAEFRLQLICNDLEAELESIASAEIKVLNEAATSRSVIINTWRDKLSN